MNKLVFTPFIAEAELFRCLGIAFETERTDCPSVSHAQRLSPSALQRQGPSDNGFGWMHR
jgi:hypothetical protein